MSAGSRAPKVTLAYLHEEELSTSFHLSLLGLVMWDGGNRRHLMHEVGHMPMRCGTGGIVSGRNQTVQAFLETDSQWLLWVDSDMGFLPDSLDRLMESADPKKRPVVGGLCFASRERLPDGSGGYRVTARPTIYTWREHEGLMRFLGVAYYPVNTLVQCDATGSAFILIHRSVFEKIGSKWYDRLPGTDGSLLGEDISFCVRCGANDVPIYVHTGIRSTHHKSQWVSETDFWRDLEVAPATQETAVIVPVMDRPQNAEPFMRSLRASTGLATVYAVANRNDQQTIAAWLDAGAMVIQCDGTTFVEKCNEGYRRTEEPWLFFTGDDVKFYPGWLDQAQHVAEMEKAKVIGTNDLGNPRVTTGKFAVHWLVEREYIAEVGASWDGPGVVCHEGYRAWFADDEIVTAAKQRGVWAMAIGSIVEHLHPLWGKGPQDAVYKIAEDNVHEDKKLFQRRLKQSTRTPVAIA